MLRIVLDVVCRQACQGEVDAWLYTTESKQQKI